MTDIDRRAAAHQRARTLFDPPSTDVGEGMAPWRVALPEATKSAEAARADQSSSTTLPN